MPPLSESAIKVMEALARHPALDLLQITARAEISVSEAEGAIQELERLGMIHEQNGVYSRDGADGDPVEESVEQVA